jgi:hypothetical protein
MLLCPNQGTGFQSVYAPSMSDGLNLAHLQATSTSSFCMFALGLSWILTQLLGKRTGNLLTVILRMIFFTVILFWTLHALISVRLFIVDKVNNNLA